TAILEMRLYKLIGLEIEALQKEHDITLANIARYTDILNNYDSMVQVIIGELDGYKEAFARKRRTVIENAQEAVFEEKKIEEQQVVFLMDKFGYARTVDVSTYERNKEAANNENKYIVTCMNTGKICIFTQDGKLHQIKVLDLPYGKFRDKGTPIDNVSNYSTADEEIVFVCDSDQFIIGSFLFATKQGMVKRVPGAEFQVERKTIVATKLQEEDALVSIKLVHGNQQVVLQTGNGYLLRYAAADIPEKKKAAIGVRGIKLQAKDELQAVHLFEEGTETKIEFKDKEVSLNRLKQARRDTQGTKYRG
ncbi:MAG: DNA gyrase C-terminal beta-propeller domain-containing protein, partial [Eubacteriales bacterium]